MTQPDIRVHGPLFLDRHGRQVILRGVNLGGDTKVPWPGGGTEVPSDFSDHRTVSFVGRPFPLNEADDHLARIAGWGFNVLRLLTTWEAVEHAGPGRYDEEYLDYLVQVAAKAGEHGLQVFIDFHQDVWARMSGGDGAPGWTFEAVGLDFRRFHAAEAALVMQNAYDYGSGERRQTAYPQMVWSSNYRLPANGVMWSLFWGGRFFTPDFEIEGRNVQDFLQGRYLGAMDAVARRVKDLPNVIGFDTLNEPGFGWFGTGLSYRHLRKTEANRLLPQDGPALSPGDQLAMLAGRAVTAPVIKGGEVVGERTMNPGGVRVWIGEDPFERHLREDLFTHFGGHELSLSEDGYGPFFQRMADTIRAHNPDWAVFAEMDPYAAFAKRGFPLQLPERTVNASHWYDVRLLHTKDYDAKTDPAETAARYARQLGHIKREAEAFDAGAPALVGEFGTPYDLDGGEAYAAWARGERDGVWAKHEAALSAMYDAMDQLQLHSTQWNYTASNRNDLRIGDRWNQEDLSIYSADQEVGGNDGGRGTAGFCRPYARAVQGRLVEVAFDRMAGTFRLAWDADPAIAGPTDVYIPTLQFPNGVEMAVEGEPLDIGDLAGQRLTLTAATAGRRVLTLRRK
ncbi:glycoside hydrolase family 5 protein [Caulobacter mirabilis]|uniref:Endoglucanase n=1 Tax=Caulobacter mirabilis TaxID=69666 RepID=A0A2D2AU23_9CAUL|nr:cellulase family glycosylhydrolase [Caulobacter mirabilis]ATQ41465.1 endoglucanase [Caulobacter mirabilis]